MAAFSFDAGARAEPVLAIAVEKQQEIITLAVPAVSPRKIFTLANPDRLVVDVPVIHPAPSLSLPGGYEGGLIKSARFGQFDPQTSRFVFELKQPVRVVDTETKDQPGRLVITVAPAGGAGAKKTSPEKSSKPVIVIDPGHGGVDPGTIGRYRTQEKDLVLSYAKALQAKLLKTGRYKVVMTREADRFIVLRQRVAIARKAKGSLFISLHADSAPEHMARGLSVYTLSEKASDQEAAALAARENTADILEGVDLTNEREDVADILISLAQRETNNLSATLADLLVTALDDKVPLLPNTHRFAGFAVLKAPDMPSVLIETGFLSNASEEKQLKSKNYQDKVTSGIVSGIDAYFKLRKEMEGQ